LTFQNLEEEKGEEKEERRGGKGQRTALTPGGYFFEHLGKELRCGESLEGSYQRPSSSRKLFEPSENPPTERIFQ
jgi:hypothetical protein